MSCVTYRFLHMFNTIISTNGTQKLLSLLQIMTVICVTHIVIKYVSSPYLIHVSESQRYLCMLIGKRVKKVKIYNINTVNITSIHKKTSIINVLFNYISIKIFCNGFILICYKILSLNWVFFI